MPKQFLEFVVYVCTIWEKECAPWRKFVERKKIKALSDVAVVALFKLLLTLYELIKQLFLWECYSVDTL